MKPENFLSLRKEKCWYPNVDIYHMICHPLKIAIVIYSNIDMFLYSSNHMHPRQ